MNYNWEDKMILIVEDTEMNFILLERILRKTKATVKWIKNGQLAVDYIVENNKVDMILMDLRMPILDGSKATKIIKNYNSNIPIIIQTASVMGFDLDQIKISGCDDYLFKPIIIKQLFEKINKHLIS